MGPLTRAIYRVHEESLYFGPKMRVPRRIVGENRAERQSVYSLFNKLEYNVVTCNFYTGDTYAADSLSKVLVYVQGGLALSVTHHEGIHRPGVFTYCSHKNL